jgi:hypothetical protein
MPAHDPTPSCENQLGEVRACDCGGVNLTMGPTTIHFNRDEVSALCELADAAEGLVVAGAEGARQKARPKVHGNVH